MDLLDHALRSVCSALNSELFHLFAIDYQESSDTHLASSQCPSLVCADDVGAAQSLDTW